MTVEAGGFDPGKWITEACADPIVAEQIVHVHRTEPRNALFREVTSPMHPLIEEQLAAAGIGNLFSHQAYAYDEAMAGNDVMVVTGTNSGKSLCYHLPALQMMLTEPASRVLYLFPTKALAQDQASKMEGLAPSPQVRIGVYDGDTPKSQRSAMRRTAHLVISNPDMLHVGVLPGHENWGTFLKSLRLIVIDEMHSYKGVFGSHVAGIIRRLLRICEWHHAPPQIIGCSATVGNPEQLFGQLTGRQPRVIDRDGSPAGEKAIAFWNPPELPNGGRLSGNYVTSELMATLVTGGHRTLAFNRSRVGAELVLRYARERLGKVGVPQNTVESYRAGYTATERRAIERAIFSGKLLGLSATSAMELGVDIGGLDTVILNGYPGSISGFWQQVGRAGRGVRNGMALMVIHEDPLEQYLARHPGELFARLPEQVSLNPDNKHILAQQLRCAAYERGLAPTELEAFSPNALEVAEDLDRSGELRFNAGRFFYPSHEAPAAGVSIRGDSESVLLLLDGKELGSMERWRAMNSAHEGAVYLHRGATYLVSKLDLMKNEAHLSHAEPDYFTQSIVQSVLKQNVCLREKSCGDYGVSLVAVNVTDIVSGYRRKKLDGDTVISEEALDLPPTTYDSIAVRIDFPELQDRDPMAVVGGVHGFEHAILAVAPLYAGCDRADLGSAWYVAFPDTMRPAVFVFDRAPGGVGLCEALYARWPEWLGSASDVLTFCDCPNGCPSCMLSSRCEVGNETLNKRAAIRLLEAVQESLK